MRRASRAGRRWQQVRAPASPDRGGAALDRNIRNCVRDGHGFRIENESAAPMLPARRTRLCYSCFSQISILRPSGNRRNPQRIVGDAAAIGVSIFAPFETRSLMHPSMSSTRNPR